MAELLIHYMAPIMFMALVVFLLLGYPVAFALGANRPDLRRSSASSSGCSGPTSCRRCPNASTAIMNNDVLLAIPFFTFMGLILERSGMAEDLLDTIGQLFGTIRGGLAYAVIFVGALLAATTGVVAASVISMGLISLPIMLRYGYDRRVASGVIAASGTLAQIIPPSLVLIVMADQLGRSVGDMYEGAFIPGLVLAALYAGYIFLVSILYPKAAPGLPVEDIGYREPDGARGVWQLGVLVLFSALVAYLPDEADQRARGRGLRRADHVARRRRLVPVRGRSTACSERGMFYVTAVAVRRLRRRSGIISTRTITRTGRCCRRRCRPARSTRSSPALIERATGFRLVSVDGRADHLRDGAAAGADLPRARHHLHRRRDADRRRRHGRGRRHDPRHDEAPAHLRPDAAGGRIDRQALGLRGVHPGRRARVLAHLLRRRRPPLGRGNAGRRCRAASSAS